MAALVGSRVLNDELHFDTLSVLLRDFTFSQLLLFASIVIYHSSLHFLPLLSRHVLFFSLPFVYPQCGRLCVTAIPDATMSLSPHLSSEYSVIPMPALAVQTSVGLRRQAVEASSDVLELQGSLGSSLVSCQWPGSGITNYDHRLCRCLFPVSVLMSKYLVV